MGKLRFTQMAVAWLCSLIKMLKTWNKCRHILPPAHRKQAIALFALITAMGILETVGVVTILPFIAVVADPSVLKKDGLLGRLYTFVGIGSETSFLILLGMLVFVMLIASNAMKAFTTWKIQRFTFMTGHTLSRDLVAAYLSQPYSYFLRRHSSDLGKNVLNEVQQVVSGVIQPGMTGLARCVVVCLLLALLIAADPLLAVSTAVVLGSGYLVYYILVRRYLSRIAQDRIAANRARYHAAVEAFAGIKEIKLRGLEDVYTANFAEPSKQFASSQSASQALASLPRYGLECIAFGGVLGIVIYLLHTRGGIIGALPLITLYAFAAYRLLPNMQEVFASAAKIRFAEPALDLLHRDLSEKTINTSKHTPPVALPFCDSIRVEKVSYEYPSSDKTVVTDVNLSIPRGARVGLVGPTGSGKSTTVDLILGLLLPTSGQVLIDGTALETDDRIRSWQRQIGYVPQHIFLADDTIAANIAFGIPLSKAEPAKIERAARMAQLHDFIVDELSDGYDTRVGERGIRLSGGQRQRLGLARALYGDPAVLVLDEATSALDTETENEVISALDGVGADRTVIMIAHRLSTLRSCDILARLEKGRLVAVGSYAEIVEKSALTSA